MAVRNPVLRKAASVWGGSVEIESGAVVVGASVVELAG